jgi:hypothetical protein
MFDYLVNHAHNNVWCTPDQDYQFIFRPARITGNRGSVNQVKIEWQTFRLPTLKETYHVYQIGQVHPRLLGVLPDDNIWHSFAELSDVDNLVVDIYTNVGIQLPRGETFFMRTGTRNVVLAVKNNPRIVNLIENELFVRFYSNAYFSSDRSDPLHDTVYVQTFVMDTVANYLLFQRDYHDYSKLKGHTYLFHNGLYVHDRLPTEVVVGDKLEFVYDSTIRDVIDLPIDSLETFVSELDGKRKYLIHIPKALGEKIDYRDDIDFWLLDKEGDKFKGVYYHKNQEDAVRMVTHNDYSIPVSYLVGFVTQNDFLNDVRDCTLRLHIRESGYDRPLVFEHNRIHELYKLNDTDIVRAMVGLDSTVSTWRAEVLEKSAYTEIMRTNGRNVTASLVQEAYGYNAITSLVANTPQRTVHDGGRWTVELPHLLTRDSTSYEYDQSGRLTGFYHNIDNKLYVARDPSTRTVETLSGIGGVRLNTAYNETTTTLDPGHNYRFYKTPYIQEYPSNDWVEAVPDVDYIINDGVVEWLLDREQFYTAVRSDSHFLSYTYQMDPEDGLLRFSVVAEEKRSDGEWYQQVCHLPLGKLELWLNGRPLIEHLDYFVSWPEIVITNKMFWVDGPQTITVRCTGFCKSDMTMEPVAEFGFVEHGLLSRNRRYDIRDDKVMRVIAGGAIQHKNELVFAEDHSGVYLDGLANGTPYVIDDVIVPVKGVDGEDTYSLKSKALLIDKEISDYLTIKLPEPPIPEISPITERYMIYSPFCSKIMYDFINGIFYPEEIKGQYSEMDVREWCKGYEWLLKYDPAVKGVDDRYVSIHPHNLFSVVELDIYQYMFLERVVKFYLDDKVDLSSFVAVKEGWL